MTVNFVSSEYILKYVIPILTSNLIKRKTLNFILKSHVHAVDLYCKFNIFITT